MTTDAERCSWAIAEGQGYLDQGGLGHNYLHSCWNLIEVRLNAHDADGALRYTTALEQYIQAEPLPWSDF